MRKFVSRASSYIIGLIILSLGVSLIIKANLGAGAWDALNVGLSETVAFTVGTWVIIIGIILIFTNAFLLQMKPDFYALITIVIVGGLIDFWLILIFSGWTLASLTLQVIVFISGLLILSFGIAVYLQAKFAPVPIDNLMIAIQKRTGFSLMVSKTIGELTAMVLAFIFGGPVGLGTIVVTFSIGPLIQMFFPKVEKVFNRIEKVSFS